MSRMICTDRGRNLGTHHEEVTRWRIPRKTLDLPAAAVGAAADLWLYVRPYADRDGVPLVVTVNGKAVEQLLAVPEMTHGWQWRRVALPRVSAKRLIVTLQADTPAMNAWMLGLDPTVEPTCSDLSTDQGKTFQRQSMGAHHALRGEYMIRLRSHGESLSEGRPPEIVYEDLGHPRLAELRSLLPASLVKERHPQRQVESLRSWVAKQWSHAPFGRVYAPWDAATILDWARRERTHGQKEAVAFCVHFAIVFAQLAAALGHRSRCIGVTQGVNGGGGHFLAEVFDAESGRWRLHDPNYDAHYQDGHWLSAADLSDRAQAGVDCRGLVVKGPDFPRGPARILRGFRDLFAPGHSYRCVGIWPRNDMISHPESSPPNHGWMTYAETDWVWYQPPGSDLTPMFPCHAPRRYFDAAPPAA